MLPLNIHKTKNILFNFHYSKKWSIFSHPFYIKNYLEIIFAGIPALIKLSSKDLVTTELAPTITSLSKVTPSRIKTLSPIQEWFPILMLVSICWLFPFRLSSWFCFRMCNSFN